MNLQESIKRILKEETEKKPRVFNYKKYTLILSNNPCDIFTHFEVEHLHGLNYKKCLAHKNTKENAYIAGLTNISPKTKKSVLYQLHVIRSMCGALILNVIMVTN